MRFFTTIMLMIFAYNLHNALALDPSIVQCTPTGTSCSLCTSYSCDSGYYGTATSASAGCTVCPSNATCTGGNDSTFLCDKGYYKSSTSCSRCPSETNYDGTRIYGTTTDTGAISMTDCYMPKNTPITDWTGTYEFTSDCYYNNQVSL